MAAKRAGTGGAASKAASGSRTSGKARAGRSVRESARKGAAKRAAPKRGAGKRKAPKRQTRRTAAVAIGRPTALTPEVRRTVVQAIRGGVYAHVAAQHAGIAPSTYYGWMARGRAERDRLLAMIEEGEDRPAPLDSERPFLEFLEAVSRADAEAEIVATLKVRQADDWRAAAWYLERRHPDRYGRRSQVEIGGIEGAPPVPVEIVEDRKRTRHVIDVLVKSGAVEAARRALAESAGALPEGDG